MTKSAMSRPKPERKCTVTSAMSALEGEREKKEASDEKGSVAKPNRASITTVARVASGEPVNSSRSITKKAPIVQSTTIPQPVHHARGARDHLQLLGARASLGNQWRDEGGGCEGEGDHDHDGDEERRECGDLVLLVRRRRERLGGGGDRASAARVLGVHVAVERIDKRGQCVGRCGVEAERDDPPLAVIALERVGHLPLHLEPRVTVGDRVVIVRVAQQKGTQVLCHRGEGVGAARLLGVERAWTGIDPPAVGGQRIQLCVGRLVIGGKHAVADVGCEDVGWVGEREARLVKCDEQAEKHECKEHKEHGEEKKAAGGEWRTLGRQPPLGEERHVLRRYVRAPNAHAAEPAGAPTAATIRPQPRRHHRRAHRIPRRGADLRGAASGRVAQRAHLGKARI
eukprot:scaffold27984_cov113-Isochrysis_galbana.AAC.5